MNSKKLILVLPLFAMLASLPACGGNSGGGGNDYKDITPVYSDAPITGSGTIKVWVGNESVEFYQAAANEWVDTMKGLSADFKFTVTVEGHDTGSVAGDLINDASACADVFTAAHDNIGKLAAGKYAKPFYDGYVYDQVKADNTANFTSVSYSIVDHKRALYGVPYIGQSLFLMYNKKYVSDEQALTFEGLHEAAVAATTAKLTPKAVTVTGTDGYNFSFPLLAQNNETHATSLKIYEGGTKNSGSCWSQGEDSVANLHWAQRQFADVNGLAWGSSAGWDQDIQNGGALSVISGAWKFKTFASAVGATNVGVAMIPTYTLTADDVAGTTVEAGTVMRGGTFADCKVFMINGYSDGTKYLAEQNLIKYLSSKSVQNDSFVECENLPAYNGAAAYIETIKDTLSASAYAMAVSQNNMFAYGIPQPFVTGTLNSYYYSKGAPAFYQLAIENASNAYGTVAALRQTLYKMQYIWQKGQEPSSVPSTLPAEI